MDKINNFIGLKYGKLTIIKQHDKIKGRQTYLCLCECGEEKITTIRKLSIGSVKTCGKCSKTSFRVGMKINRFLIIEDLTNKSIKNGQTRYKCQCDCGIIKEVAWGDLQAENAKSCGCLNKDNKTKYSPVIGSAKTVYKRYRDGNLTFEQFYEMSQKNCFYCDAPPNNKTNGYSSTKNTKEFFDNGYFIYNGLDRVNNKFGHDFENCVPCCKTCNYSKREQTVEEFEYWVDTAFKGIIKNQNIDITKYDGYEILI